MDKKNCYKNCYDYVLEVWHRFQMKTMEGYHNFYLKCDVLLLADVSEQFRSDSLKS